MTACSSSIPRPGLSCLNSVMATMMIAQIKSGRKLSNNRISTWPRSTTVWPTQEYPRVKAFVKISIGLKTKLSSNFTTVTFLKKWPTQHLPIKDATSCTQWRALTLKLETNTKSAWNSLAKMLRKTKSSSASTITHGKWISSSLTHVNLQGVLTRILSSSRFLFLMKFPRRTKKNLTSIIMVISQASLTLKRGGYRRRSQSHSWQCSKVERFLKWILLSVMHIKTLFLTLQREPKVDQHLIVMEMLSGL